MSFRHNRRPRRSSVLHPFNAFAAQMVCEPLESRRLLTAAVVDNTINAAFGIPTVIPVGPLLGDDTDIGSISNFNQPANGTVTRDPVSGNLTYTPRAGFRGSDSFTFTARGFTAVAGATLYIGEGDLDGDGNGVGVGGGEISIDSFNMSVANPDGQFIGEPDGQAIAGTFDFSVALNAASPGFLAAVANGRTVDRLTLIQRAAGPSGAVERLRWTLSDARFLQYAQTDDSKQAGSAREQFSVSFASAKLQITAADSTPTSSAQLDQTTHEAAGSGQWPLADLNSTGGRAGLFLEATSPGPGKGLPAGAANITSINFGLSNSGSIKDAPSASDFADVQITLPSGDGSAQLLRSAVLGGGWGNLVLVRRAAVGRNVVELERYVLHNARVTSFSDAGTGTSALDTATLSYQSIDLTTTPVANGIAGIPSTTTFSRLTNTGTGGTQFGQQTVPLGQSMLQLSLGTGQMAIDNYEWAVSSDIPQPVPGQHPPEVVASVANFTLQAPVGAATDGLLAAAADQRTIGSVQLIRTDSGGRIVERWDLSRVRVSAFSVSTGATGNPIQTFGFSASIYKQTVDFPDPLHPAATDPRSGSFDVVHNLPTNPGFSGRRLPTTASGLLLSLDGSLHNHLVISSADWAGLANAASPGSDTPAGRPQIGAITLTAPTGQESAALFAAASSGRGPPISTMKLSVVRAGQQLLTPSVYTFTGVRIGQYEVSDNPKAGGSVDTFTLFYESVTVQQAAIDPKTGILGTPKSATYDATVATNFASGAGAFTQTAPLALAKEAAAGNRLQAIGPSSPLTAAEAGAVDVKNFSFEMDNPSGGKAGFQPVTVTLDAGPASVAFFKSAATGAHWSKIVLTSGTGGANPFVRTRLTLLNATVISYQTTISGAAGAKPLDVITLSYDVVRMVVTPTDAAGKALPPLSTNINVRRNVDEGSSAVPTRSLSKTQGFVLDLPADVAVQSFGWDEQNDESRPGTGGTAGQPVFDDFTFTAPPGSASAGLLLSAFSHQKLGNAITFRGRALAGGGFASLWGLKDVFVDAFSTSFDAQGKEIDTFRLKAVAVDETVSAPGKPAVNRANWNSASNTGTAPTNFGRNLLQGPADLLVETVHVNVAPPNNLPPSKLVINPQIQDPDDNVTESVLVDPFDGAPVGILNATDPDANDALTFSLLNTAGGRFKLVGTEVQVADGGHIAGNTRYTITARVTDRAGAFIDRDFIVDVPAVTQLGNILILNGTDGNDRISFTQGAAANSPVFATINGLTIGGLNGLTLTQVIVNTGDGNDLVGAAQLSIPAILRGGAGGDSLFGGSAGDALVGGTGDDSLSGNDGDDSLDGGPGNDSLDGGAGDDLLLGGDDNDTLVGGLGRDTIRGGNGNDLVRFPDINDDVDLGDGQDGVEFRGTGGNDTIVVDINFYRLPEDPHPELSDAQFQAAAEAGLIQHGHIAVMHMNGQTFQTRAKSCETIFVLAGAGNDNVSVTPLASHHWKMSFHGGAGDDHLTGGEKNDQLFGDGDNDTLDGGEGDDFVDGGAGDDIVMGGVGNDSLLGGTGNDRLFGGDGDDYLNSRDSITDAVLDGGTGFDSATKDPGDIVTAVEHIYP